VAVNNDFFHLYMSIQLFKRNSGKNTAQMLM